MFQNLKLIFKSEILQKLCFKLWIHVSKSETLPKVFSRSEVSFPNSMIQNPKCAPIKCIFQNMISPPKVVFRITILQKLCFKLWIHVSKSETLPKVFSRSEVSFPNSMLQNPKCAPIKCIFQNMISPPKVVFRITHF